MISRAVLDASWVVSWPLSWIPSWSVLDGSRYTYTRPSWSFTHGIVSRAMRFRTASWETPNLSAAVATVSLSKPSKTCLGWGLVWVLGVSWSVLGRILDSSLEYPEAQV